MMDNLETICSICKLSFWEWDINQNLFKQYGYFGSFNGTFQEFLQRIHLADRSNLEETILQNAKNGQLFEKKFRIPRTDNSLKWVFIRGRATENQNKLSGIILGVNDWKKNEDNHYQNQLRLMESMEHSSFNGIISLLAHELTQPLMVINTYISGCIYRLNEDRIDKKQLIDVMTNIKQHSALIGEKIHKLKDFHTEPRLTYSETNIHEVIHESVLLLSYELQTLGIKMSFDFQDNMPAVKMDKIQIKQVIYNLLRNSIESMREGLHSLAIKTKKIDDESIKVIIKDSYTNKREIDIDTSQTSNISNKYQGLKIGLAICRNIIEAHGGTLSTKLTNNGCNHQFTLHS